MSISLQARGIAPSPTFALNEKARLLREKGEPVINLGIGEPKNKTPITAILSSVARLREGDVKYTRVDGIPSLKKAIIRYTEENYGEVILLAPYWVSYPEMVKMCYANPVIVVPEDGTFYHRMEEVERVASSYTKAIILNSPNNPSGAMYPAEFIAKMVEFCESKGIYLIMDDIYHKLVYQQNQWKPAWNYTDKDIENTRVIVVNGVSKLYGMTGFRVGWAIAPRKLVEIMTNVQGQMTSNPAIVLQSAAEGALTGQQGLVENLRMTFENNRQIILNELKAFSDLKVVPPDGTFYVMPDFRAYGEDSTKIANFLLEKALVVTVPGKEFGMEGFIRLSFAGAVKDIIEGIERLRWALDPKAPNEIYIGDRKLIRDWL
jgi:aspartate aminotransferase